MSRDQILALDIATKTGWALLDLDGVRIASGTWLATPTVRQTCRWARWLDGLDLAVPTADRLACIAVEAQIERGRAWGNGRVAAGLRAHLELWAFRRNVPVAEWAPASVKLAAAGHGGASKFDVARAMRRRFGLRSLAAGDEADALAVGVTALERLDLDELRCGHVVRRDFKPAKRRAKAKAVAA